MVASHKEAIEVVGDAVALARDLGQEADTVRRWKLRDSIPGAFWLDIEQLAKQHGIKGVTVERLAQLARERRDIKRPGRPPLDNGKGGGRLGSQPKRDSAKRRVAAGAR